MIPRREFIDQRWVYKAGEHLTTLGASGCGKTKLMNDLLAVTATPTLQSIYLCMKHQDDTVTDFAREHGHRIVSDWPVPAERMAWWRNKPSGYILWTAGEPTEDPAYDESLMAGKMVRAMHHAYSHKRRKRSVPYILVMDEAVELSELRDESRRPPIIVGDWTNAVLSRGRSMGVGGWLGTQRPAGLNYKAYNGAIHLLLFREDDARNRKRFGEIGGFDPKLVEGVVAQLPDYHALYLCKRPGARAICVIGDR